MSWAALRAATAARIGLARSGASLATAPLLEMRLAHARARDAVHAEVDEAGLAAAVPGLVAVSSRATGRREYLMRPDLGRALDEASLARLAALEQGWDLALVLGDGLSPMAVQRHAGPLLELLRPWLERAGWRVAPPVLVRGARVKAGDVVAGALGAAAVLVLIGERPGLSSPDSLGAYLTWRPRAETLDSGRNCVSNIRPEGLGYAEAAGTLRFLLGEMRRLGVSGVALKDGSGAGAIVAGKE